MSKIFLLLAVAALLVLPSLALAQTEFSLGGYIKLDTFWDSTSMNKNLTSAVTRGNNPTGQHGRFNATSQSSRFNFTFKGPKLERIGDHATSIAEEIIYLYEAKDIRHQH